MGKAIYCEYAYIKIMRFNPFKPEFTIVIITHNKPRTAVAILDF